MFDINNIIGIPAFSLAKREKAALHRDVLCGLTRHHYLNCPQYRKILDMLGFDPAAKGPAEDLPFIPARLFKDYKLLSVKEDQIVKTMVSSGTTGQRVSKVFLDKATAAGQIKALAKIISSFAGAKRLPMLIIDAKSAIEGRSSLSARAAGILGFSMFGRDLTYALSEDMRIDFKALEEFCARHRDEDILLFGFTYIIWEYFYKELVKAGKNVTLDRGIMIHGGGWKKLNAQAVDNDTFKSSLENACGIRRIHNYYGMVEQAGSIFMECEAGHLHSSIFSNVITRRADFSVCPPGEKGLVQVISLLPLSYPGHSILSEDNGEIAGEDDCPCGRLGRYFKIHGRVKSAEIRGCSDTYASAR